MTDRNAVPQLYPSGYTHPRSESAERAAGFLSLRDKAPTAPSNLTPRATHVLMLLGRLRFLTQAQLQAFLFSGQALSPHSPKVLVRRVLKSLTAMGMVRADPRYRGGPGGGSSCLVYSLTARGLRMATVFDQSLMGRPLARGPHLSRHALMTADGILTFYHSAVANVGHSISWQADWQLRLAFGSRHIIPDAGLTYATPTIEVEALLEVDTGTEGASYFLGKIGRYLALWRGGWWQGILPTWPVILTVTPTDFRAQFLKRAVQSYVEARIDRGEIAAGTEFAFASLPKLQSEGPLARVWWVVGRDEARAILPDTERQNGVD